MNNKINVEYKEVSSEEFLSIVEKANVDDFGAVLKMKAKIGEYYTPYIKIGEKYFNFTVEIPFKANIIGLYKEAGTQITESKKHKISISGKDDNVLAKACKIYCEKMTEFLKNYELPINIAYQSSRIEKYKDEKGFDKKRTIAIEPRIWFVLPEAIENKQKVAGKYGGEIIIFKRVGNDLQHIKLVKPQFTTFKQHIPSGSSAKIAGKFMIDNFHKGEKDITFTFSISSRNTFELAPISRTVSLSKEEINKRKEELLKSDLFNMISGDGEETNEKEEKEDNTVFTKGDLEAQNDENDDV